MKKAFKGTYLVIVILILVSMMCLIACGETDDTTPDTGNQDGGDNGTTIKPIIYTLVLKASSTEATRGDKITLNAVLKSENGEEPASEDVEYIVEAGAEYVSLKGNSLTVKSNANHGTIIKVKAREGATDSNAVDILVKVPVTDIEISANGATNLLAGSSTILSSDVTPYGSANDVNFVITEGEEVATIAGNVLVVNGNATTGETIKVKAVSSTAESNELTFTVGYPLETLLVSVLNNVTNVKAGETALLNVTLTPQNATNGAYVWEFVEGGDYATITNNAITVKSDAPTGAIVRVKAVADTISSNVVEFTVGYPLETILVSVVDNVTNVLKGGTALLNVTLTPQNATNGAYVWEFVEGGDYATITNNAITVKDDAPTGAIVKVKAVAGAISSNVVEFTVGYPLKGITASVSGAGSIKTGESANLSVVLNPQNATDVTYEWVFVAGGDYATISGDVITVNLDAPDGASIKVKAVAGNISSNELTIAVSFTPIESIEVATTAPQILARGGEYDISFSVTPSTALTNTVSWVVTKGEDYVSVESNKLVVKSDVPAGTKVAVKAVSGAIESDELNFTIGVAVEELAISLIGSANVDPTDVRSINSTINPNGATDKSINWVIKEGSDFATLVNGILTVKEDAPIGATVTFYGEIGAQVNAQGEVVTIKSNELTITVGIPVETITISAGSTTEIVKGNSTTLYATVAPTGAPTSITWKIIDGAENATLVGTTLTIKADATTGATVKVQASFVNYDGEVLSNVLSFIVMATQEEINATRYFLDVNNSSINLDKKGDTTPVIQVAVKNFNYEEVDNMDVEFTIIDGESCLEIAQNGYNCNLTAVGHGNAKVKVSLKGYDVEETINVNVIVPPDRIVLPEVFAQRTDIVYAYSNVDPLTNETQYLPFEPTIQGDALACQDLEFTFLHEDGTTGTSVARREGTLIRFLKTGRVTLTVSSASGSKHEATVSYNFNINDGYNVGTYEELQYMVEGKYFEDSRPINLAVFSKPVSQTEYKYGYDIVPQFALKPQSQQTVREIRNNGRIQAVNKSLWINGNNHVVDVSQTKVYNKTEYDAYVNDTGITGEIAHNHALFSLEPWHTSGVWKDDNADGYMDDYDARTYDVRFYDFEFKGNAPIDYDPTVYNGTESDPTLYGVYATGLLVGDKGYKANYNVDINNITASGFVYGMRFERIVGSGEDGMGKISNLYAYNCYSTGIVVRASMVKLENLKFGPCGATGIEVAAEYANQAGVNFNQTNHIEIAGTVEASTNLNDGNTSYFKYYKIGGAATIPQIITGNTQQYANNQVSHVRNEKGQFIFVSLVFCDMDTFAPNPSIVDYSAYQEGGVINIASLPTDGTHDTTHQFIEMPIFVELGATIQVGTAYFYNHYYNG